MTEPARVVILEFADMLRVDIVAGMSETEAVSDFFGRVMRGGSKPTLPLFRWHTIEVPEDRLRELVNGAVLIPLPKPAEPITISVRGALAAFSAYVRMNEDNATIENHEKAKDRLRSFFEPLGIQLDFTPPR